MKSNNPVMPLDPTEQEEISEEETNLNPMPSSSSTPKPSIKDSRKRQKKYSIQFSKGNKEALRESRVGFLLNLDDKKIQLNRYPFEILFSFLCRKGPLNKGAFIFRTQLKY